MGRVGSGQEWLLQSTVLVVREVIGCIGSVGLAAVNEPLIAASVYGALGFELISHLPATQLRAIFMEIHRPGLEHYQR